MTGTERPEGEKKTKDKETGQRGLVTAKLRGEIVFCFTDITNLLLKKEVF